MSPESQRIDRARAAWGHALRAVQENPQCKFSRSILTDADKELSAAWADFHKAKDAANNRKSSRSK